MPELTSKGVPPLRPPEEQEWPCPNGCNTKQDDYRKALIIVITMFFSGFPVLVMATSGPTQQEVHSQTDEGCPGLAHLGHATLNWLKTSGLKQSWFPVLAILLGIFFYKGGSIRIKGRGLVSGAARRRGE